VIFIGQAGRLQDIEKRIDRAIDFGNAGQS
jgi:hypothetical protein